MQTKHLLFLFGCIPARSGLAVLAYFLSKSGSKWLFPLGILFLLIGLSFLILYFGNLRLTAPEAVGTVWWKKLRLLHGMLYIVAGIYAIQKRSTVWIPIVLDVILGLSAFIWKEGLNREIS
jgi:hypothetical protein